jgi:peroxiredoxin
VTIRTTIKAAAIAAALALFTAGCNRGGYPDQVGSPAPNFTIHDDAQTVALSQYRGKTVVLNFWASWCAPCLEEWPSMEQLQHQFPNLVVLAVAFDTDPSDYRQYLADNRLTNMTVVLDRTQQSNLAFGTTRPPESYIIDKNGIIRRKFIGAQDWSSPEIQQYLSSL